MKTKNIGPRTARAKGFDLREVTALSLILSLIFVLSILKGMFPPLPFHMRFGVVDEARGKQEKYRRFSAEFFDTFDTRVSFTAFAKDEAEFERYVNIVHDEMSRLHRLFDIYHDYDGLVNLKTVNEAAGTVPVTVDSDIVRLLELAKAAYEDTGGAVDVALGPVLAIWHEHREKAAGGNASVPSLAELQAAAVRVSAHDILLDRENSTVLLRYPGMSLDVGAIAKGYAVERAVERVRESGLRSGLLNAGGNVAVVGGPLDGRATWNVGVRAPGEGKNASAILDILYLADGSAVTSGTDQRYFMAEGRRWHHIVDPKTLFPAEGVSAVTVLHADSAVADVLSTAAFILPREEARALIAKHGAEAIWIEPDGTKFATPGYLKLSKLGGASAGNARNARNP
jgi:thiamine biosynthesis lipoprotein